MAYAKSEEKQLRLAKAMQGKRSWLCRPPKLKPVRPTFLGPDVTTQYRAQKLSQSDRDLGVFISGGLQAWAVSESARRRCAVSRCREAVARERPC